MIGMLSSSKKESEDEESDDKWYVVEFEEKKSQEWELRRIVFTGGAERELWTQADFRFDDYYTNPVDEHANRVTVERGNVAYEETVDTVMNEWWQSREVKYESAENALEDFIKCQRWDSRRNVSIEVAE